MRCRGDRRLIVRARLTAAIRGLPLVLFLVLHASIARAQHATPLVVTVGDAGTHGFLKDAEIVLVDIRRYARTNELGEARITNVPNGMHHLRVRALGYAPSDIDLAFDGDTVGPVFLLERAATTLDAVHVVSTWATPHLADFERRRSMGIGRFMTDSALSRIQDQDLGIVMQTHFPGLRSQGGSLVSMRGSCGGAIPLSAGGGTQSAASGSCFSGACAVRVYVDGVNYPEGLDVLPTWAIAGIEYYTGASTPVEYRVLGSACGTVLLWSKL